MNVLCMKGEMKLAKNTIDAFGKYFTVQCKIMNIKKRRQSHPDFKQI